MAGVAGTLGADVGAGATAETTFEARLVPGTIRTEPTLIWSAEPCSPLAAASASVETPKESAISLSVSSAATVCNTPSAAGTTSCCPTCRRSGSVIVFAARIVSELMPLA